MVNDQSEIEYQKRVDNLFDPESKWGKYRKYISSPEMIAKRSKGKLASTPLGFMGSACDSFWDPVWGCKNNCPYCYGREYSAPEGNEAMFDFSNYILLAKQEYDYMKSKGITINQDNFADRLKNFIPTFIESNFNIELPETPQIIWANSMTDICYWKQKWIIKVLNKIKKYPQHIFRFLTRFPDVYLRYDFPENCWLGVTIDKNADLYKMNFTCWGRIKCVTLQALQEKIDVGYIDYVSKGAIYNPRIHQKIDWLLVGNETRKREGTVVPTIDWIESIVDCCRRNDIPVFLKPSLMDIYPEQIREFPRGSSILEEMKKHYKKGEMVCDRVNYLKEEGDLKNA